MLVSQSQTGQNPHRQKREREREREETTTPEIVKPSGTTSPTTYMETEEVGSWAGGCARGRGAGGGGIFSSPMSLSSIMISSMHVGFLAKSG